MKCIWNCWFNSLQLLTSLFSLEIKVSKASLVAQMVKESACNVGAPGSIHPRLKEGTWVSSIAGRFFIVWATKEAPYVP